MSKRSKRVAICLVTDHQDNVLMGCRNDNGKWASPAGGIEKKEDPFAAATRELKEETGLDVVDIKLVGAHWDKDRNLLLYLFKIEVNPAQPMDWSKDPDKEFKEIKFVNPNDVVENLHVPVEHNIALKYWINS